ncbi:MAG: aminodeoxychorismate synthase component I [Peptococcaceae bacterium]|nr:aminodeoxychorismate synthase component I [Peptococcaceae bacterium]MDH7524845.1 aminodeoxychorismate synthase component I [Peptococcaceae bacterium]
MQAVKALIEPIETGLEPFELFKIFKDEPYSFFLDSGIRGVLGKYSFLGSRPFLVFKSKGKQVEIIQENKSRYYEANPFDILEKYYRRFQIKNPSTLPFVGGCVGYFAYDLNRQIETLPSINMDNPSVPDCVLGFYDSVVIIDHLKNRAYIAATGLPETEQGKALQDAEMKISRLKKKIATGPARSPELTPASRKNTWLYSNFTRESYLAAVKRALKHIYAGDIYQVNLSQRFCADFAGNPLEIYGYLREINPAPFACFLNFSDVTVACSSPERFLKLRNGMAETRPIKGTRPRGQTLQEDLRSKEELINSVKDQAELLMIVDLERNDLGRVCIPGSIKVTELFTIEEYATVFHLIGNIQGRLKEGKDIIDLLRAAFPGGSVTGAPKIRAMEIIEELEPHKRNIYTGSIGYMGFNGDADLNIVIRTLIFKDNKVYLQVGGGIVSDSEPEREYEETLDKARALIRALRGRIFPQ